MLTSKQGRCRCGVKDWKALRRALGKTQEEMGQLLGLGARGIRYLEGAPHHCPREASLMLLRAWLQDPELRGRLERSGLEADGPW